MGETEKQALRRELQEEIAASSQIGARLWQNRSVSGVLLSWYEATLDATCVLRPNPEEVEAIHWLTADELRGLDGLLATNLDFLSAVGRGDVLLAGS